MSEWIEHKGSDCCPVDPKALVFIRMRDGHELDKPYPAFCFRWSHLPENEWSRSHDITAYRIHNPDSEGKDNG